MKKKLKKIMFNDKYGLTKAVLDNRKTQTRRAIKLKDGEYVKVVQLENGEYMSYIAKKGRETAHVGALEMPDFVKPLPPHFFIDEEVAVAQTYFDCGTKWAREHIDIASDLIKRSGYRNKMFVKADFMPHRIKITNIRIERLKDIEHHWTDALCEGVMLDMDAPVGEQFYIKKDGVKEFFLSATEAFASLIDKVSGKGTWDSNPYVFVYDFKLVK